MFNVLVFKPPSYTVSSLETPPITVVKRREKKVPTGTPCFFFTKSPLDSKREISLFDQKPMVVASAPEQSVCLSGTLLTGRQHDAAIF